MSPWIRSARAAAFVALAASARSAAGVDVLEGLTPADFGGERLGAAEARAFAPHRTVALPGGKPAEANPLGRTDGATTLAELGVGSGATELAVSGVTETHLLPAATPEQRRALSTLAVLGVLDGAVGDGGAVDVGEVLEDLDDVLGDLDGTTEDLLDDLLGNDGLVPGLLDEDGGLLDLPAEDLQEILDDLPVQLPISLPGLLP